MLLNILGGKGGVSQKWTNTNLKKKKKKKNPHRPSQHSPWFWDHAVFSRMGFSGNNLYCTEKIHCEHIFNPLCPETSDCVVTLHISFQWCYVEVRESDVLFASCPCCLWRRAASPMGVFLVWLMALCLAVSDAKNRQQRGCEYFLMVHWNTFIIYNSPPPLFSPVSSRSLRNGPVWLMGIRLTGFARVFFLFCWPCSATLRLSVWHANTNKRDDWQLCSD